MTTPAGWYADPTDPALFRWWSGAAWTEHVAPAVVAVPAGAAVSAGAGVAAPAYSAAGVASGGQQGALRPYSLDASPEQLYRSTEFAAVDPRQLKRGERDRLIRRLNPVGYTSIVVALLSLLIGLAGLTGIAGIILALIGIAKANRLIREGNRLNGRAYSINALWVSTLSLVLTVWLWDIPFVLGFIHGVTGR